MIGEVTVREIETQPVLGIRTKTAAEEAGDLFMPAFAKVWRYLEDLGVKPSGMPFMRFYEFGDDTLDAECGITLAEPLPGSGEIQAGWLPGGRAVTVSYFGPYEQLPEAHAAVQAYIVEYGLQRTEPPWEFYMNGPEEEPDSAKWQTDIFYPVD